MRSRVILVATIATLFLAGIGTAGAADYLAQAKQMLAKGQIKAAEIELKNAVRSNPRDMAARYRLARVELQLGEAAAAEEQAKAARQGGYDPDRTIPLLADTYLVQHKYVQLLREFPGDSGSAAQRAGVLVARGYAQIALAQPAAAQASFAEAERLAPKAPQPLLAEAKLLIAHHQFAAAQRKLDQALSLAPRSAALRITKAELLRITGHPKAALDLLNRTLIDAPTSLPARLERAEILLSNGKDELARSDISGVLAAQPGNVGAIYLQALLYARSGKFKQADANLERISGAIPAIPRGYYVQAMVKFRLGELAQAEDAAQRYAARNPSDLAGKNLLGLIALAQGRAENTIETLENVAGSGKADAATYDLLGRAYLQVGNAAKASAAFKQAVKLAPKNASLRLQLGESRLRYGDTTGAIADLEQSLQIAPSATASEALVLTQLSAGRWKDATGTATKLQKLQPTSPVPGNLLGLIKLAQFDLAGAQTEFAALAAKYPSFLPAQLNLARVAELEGKTREAEEILQKLLDKEPANGIVLTRFVNLMRRNGKQAEALAAAERAHAAAPTDKGITAGLISLYLQLNQKEKALVLAQQESGANDPENVPLIAARVKAELATGHKSGAEQDIRRLIGISPSAIGLRRELAAVLLSAGDTAGARQTIDAAMKIAPHDPQLIADRLAIDLKAGGTAAALTSATRLQKSDPSLPSGAALPGDVYMMARDYAKAAAAYASAFRRFPSAPLAVKLAEAQSAGGHAATAAATLRDWIAKHPTDIGLALILAGDDIAAHRFAKAQQELEAVLAKAPQNAVAINNLAWLYGRSGDPRARSLAERAYLLAPGLAQTEDTLGWILVKQGQPANAIGLLMRASAGRSDPAIQYHLAVALNDLGRSKEAVAVLKPLLKTSSSFDDKAAAEKLFTELSKG